MTTTDAASAQARSAMRPVGWLVPDWPVADGVHGFVTTRAGGVSGAPYDTLNLGAGAPGAPHDDAAAVAANRRIVGAHLPGPPAWLQQVHGADVVAVDATRSDAPRADAAVTRTPDRPLVVLVADCLPVMLAARDGTVIGVAHAGWRGLAAGVVERTVDAMAVAPSSVCAWLGPCIGPAAFEVGDEVRDAFIAQDAAAARAFAPYRAGKWLADLPALARRRLRAAGVSSIAGGDWCTVSDPARFYSYRRDGATGRFGAFLWIAGAPDVARPA
jgi:YfiH family protein